MRVGAKDLHDHFTAWAEAGGGASWTLRGLKGAMEDRGFKSIQSDGVKWLGVKIRDGLTLDAVKAGDWPQPEGATGQAGSPSGLERVPGDNSGGGVGRDPEPSEDDWEPEGW